MQQPPSANQRPSSSLEEDESDLIGTPPKFDGNRENSLSFLNQFNLFILLNENSVISTDPYMRAAYFLNMLRGPPATIEWFKHQNIKWFSQVESNPDLLPKGMNVWEVLEADFKKSFEDIQGPWSAGSKLEKLRMKEDRLDDYIAEFEHLARRAEYRLDQGPTPAVRTFVRGLPYELAKACYVHTPLDTFDQWTSAVRREYPRWQAINQLPASLQSPNRGGAFVGWRNGQTAGQDIVPQARPRTTPHDSNSSRTVGTNQRAITHGDKEEYLRDGRCFHCGVQGHIVRSCPNRRPRHRTTGRT